METKADIAKFIGFRVKFFRFPFISVFCNFLVSVNGIEIFPLTDIFVSVNRTAWQLPVPQIWLQSLPLCTL